MIVESVASKFQKSNCSKQTATNHGCRFLGGRSWHTFCGKQSTLKQIKTEHTIRRSIHQISRWARFKKGKKKNYSFLQGHLQFSWQREMNCMYCTVLYSILFCINCFWCSLTFAGETNLLVVIIMTCLFVSSSANLLKYSTIMDKERTLCVVNI